MTYYLASNLGVSRLEELTEEEVPMGAFETLS